MVVVVEHSISDSADAVAANPDSLLAKLTAKNTTGRSAFDAKEKGCPVGAAVVDEYAENIAIGLKGLQWIFQPDAIILGGAISAQGENLLARS